MSNVSTDRLLLPLLASGQAQKEIAHNEALLGLDMLVQPVAQSMNLSQPPAAPLAGQCWIIASGASSAWAGQEDSLACWSENGWRFATPGAGWQVWVEDVGLPVWFDGMGWVASPVRSDSYVIDGQQILSGREPSVTAPTGGTTVDQEARAALAEIINRLISHGLIES